MNLFLLNTLLAIAWSALTGSASLMNFLVGFIIGYAALQVSNFQSAREKYFRRVPKTISLSVFFLRELVLSSLRVAQEVLSPKMLSTPRIMRVPLEIRDPNQILVLTSLISLTPGTLVLDVTPENDAMIVHTMFVEDPEAFRREIREGFEYRVREAMS
ncbi:Na+/H+ antiporter subunit E [Biformimicrobium ophioploci]|uniref:Na+/H+ antiporter subunit E n=1 Tax=Biformimicrobium ophioploci TaxID=3036711 RepID=A0ABQ6LYC7_9GAMM|nr:Na+/H+ antiporter subunit E [Microbulbifer sp. NKW57]GMG87081.1 Na+/H+ antiporter subunit E [Microbulbifer sp. NKW57]